MNDPHVVSLTYSLASAAGVSFDTPPPLVFDRRDFSGRLEDGKLVLSPKDHFPSVATARVHADRFVKSWELDAQLSSHEPVLSFQYETAEVVDRDPPAPGSSQAVSAGVADVIVFGDRVSVHVTRRQYPQPPKVFEVTPDVEALWQRLEAHRLGQETLLSMAYFCLTWIQRMGPTRSAAAKRVNVERKVLDTLGELTSERGDERTARKAPSFGQHPPLTKSESTWILAALRQIVRNLGELPSGQVPRLRMQDLPPL